MKKVLLDTNIVLDLLLQREPFCFDAKEIFRYIENNRIKGFLCATTITTIYYLASKKFSKSQTNKIIENLMFLFEITNINKDTLIKALYENGKDYEDSVIYTSARLNDIDFIVTRDLRGFKNSQVDTLLSKEFLAILSKKF